MIALVLSSAWPQYYASSPFLNLLQSSHPRFKIFGKLPHEIPCDKELQDEINQCEAVVVDDVLVGHMGFYNGLKLMVGGDPHAHKQEQVDRLIREYAAVDYVLTGAVFSKRLEDRYLYPPAETWRKHLYFPHMVPDKRPATSDWAHRSPEALLSGSMDQRVYPFRAACRSLRGKGVQVLELNNYQHEGYFEHLGRYRYAITCNSNFEYTVAKYFEIPWMGTILLAPPPSEEERELLGFEQPVPCTWTKSPDEVLRYVTTLNDHEDPLGRVLSRMGQSFMERHHTAHRRLDYIAHLIDRIKQGNFTPDDAKDCFLKHRQGTL